MDKVIKVRRSFLNEIRAFCSSVVSTFCGRCFHNPCNCEFVTDIARAKMLMFRIDNIRDAEEERFYVENQRDELFDKLVIAIRQGGGRVESKNIRIPGVTRQNKFYALKTLVKRRVISYDRTAEGKVFYTVRDREDKNKTNEKENTHGIQP